MVSVPDLVGKLKKKEKKKNQKQLRIGLHNSILAFRKLHRTEARHGD